MADPQQPRRLLVQDSARREDVEVKHDRVRGLLKATGAEAVLLQEPSNVAWFTAGADLYRCASEDCSTSIFVTSDARLFATNSVDSSQVFEREAFGLGFQLKQREWFQPHKELVADLCRGRKVLSDRGVSHTKPARRPIRNLRLPLTPLEVERVRMLSQIAVHAVEATGHNLRPGVTESELAGEVSHRLLKRTVTPTRIHVCADGRNERYRHWTFGQQPVKDFAVISCVARRWGLHSAVTRTVCLGVVPETLLASYRIAALVHATGMYFSRSGSTLGNVFQKVHRIYEKFGKAQEWLLADQANVFGYSASEAQVCPDSDYTICTPAPVFWHPSVGAAMLGDTVLCHDDSNEQLTLSSSWPGISVKVKGNEVTCPGILLLDATNRADGTAVAASSEDYVCPDHPEEEQPEAVESVWEMRVPTDRPVWAEDDSPWSPESVLE